MKKSLLFILLLGAIIAFNGCKEDTPQNDNGFIEFRCVNPMGSKVPSGFKLANGKMAFANPLLTGDTTETTMLSLKICIGDVWVSTDEVTEGNADNLNWIKLTSETNTVHKLFEEFSFPAVEVPAGEYKSIKITFKNIFYRHLRLNSDTTVFYEILETMGSSFDPCDPDDDSWARANYFSTGGNYYLDNDGFKLASAGEKVSGFTIQPGKKAKLAWRFGAGVTEPCTVYLLDLNQNLEWDCGIDDMKISCPPSLQYMWDFVVVYD